MTIPDKLQRLKWIAAGANIRASQDKTRATFNSHAVFGASSFGRKQAPGNNARNDEQALPMNYQGTFLQHLEEQQQQNSLSRQFQVNEGVSQHKKTNSMSQIWNSSKIPVISKSMIKEAREPSVNRAP